MSSDDNVKTIQSVYEAFQRGDVAAIVESVTDDVDWATEGAGNVAPWWGERHGPSAVGEFFQAFGSAMEVEEFTPLVMTGTGDDVLTLVRFRAKSRATGKSAAMNLHHHFVVRDGKIARYRGSEDTLLVAETLT